MILNEPNKNYSQCDATDICNENSFNKKKHFSNNTPYNTIKINRQKISVKYGNKSFDDFRFLFIDPPQKLAYDKSKILSASFGLSGENQSRKVISNMVLSHILKSWGENKTQLHTSSIEMSLSEHTSLKFCFIIKK